MHFKSYIEVFDTTPLTPEHPYSPHGVLFTYYPSEEPENLHYHNFLELGYCESGTGVFIIDGEMIPFHGKCTSIIYDGQVHIAKSVNNEKSLWHFIYIDLSKLFTGVEANELKTLVSLEHDKYRFPNIIPYEEDEGIYALCREIMAEAATEQSEHLTEIRNLVIALLIKHGRYFEKKGNDVRERASLMDEIGELLNYVNIHYMENIGIDDLVQKTHMSKATLQRKMTSFFGVSPMQYIHHLRLNHAALLLLEKKKTITEIASEVGYNSLSSFNRMFLKEFGMSPSDWRRSEGSQPSVEKK